MPTTVVLCCRKQADQYSVYALGPVAPARIPPPSFPKSLIVKFIESYLCLLSHCIVDYLPLTIYIMSDVSLKNSGGF